MEEFESNPFGNRLPAKTGGGAVAKTDQQRAVAEVQAAMMIAKMNPRDQIAAMDRILNACTRPGLALSATYTYAKGGTEVTGPSIRLAETLAQNWGNISFGIRELDQQNGESQVQAFCWDMETNVRREVTFYVPHTLHTKSGIRKLKDPREIYEMVANQGSRRVRACILAVIPGDVVESAVGQCERTLHTTAKIDDNTVPTILEKFAEHAVTQAQIEKRIQRRIDAIVPAQVVALRQIYNSLRDGMSTPAEWFDFEESAAAGQTSEKVPSAREKLRPKDPPAQAEVAEGDKKDAVAPTLATISDAMNNAKTMDDLDIIADQIRALPDEKDRVALGELYLKNRMRIDPH